MEAINLCLFLFLRKILSKTRVASLRGQRFVNRSATGRCLLIYQTAERARLLSISVGDDRAGAT